MLSSLDSKSGCMGKRTRRAIDVDDDELDDILNQITAKMDRLETPSEDERKEHSLNAFMEVLDCATHDAEFYLESAGWDIQTAVTLWLENNQITIAVEDMQRTKQTDADRLNDMLIKLSTLMGNFNAEVASEDEIKDFNLTAFIDVLGCSLDDARFYLESADWDIQTAMALLLETNPIEKQQQSKEQKWVAREVVIKGLNPEWTARVSKSKGKVLFLNRLNGTQQWTMPPLPVSVPQSETPISEGHEAPMSVADQPSSSDDVVVEGISPEWKAKVNSSKRMYFVHIPTGENQWEVPPGFADVPQAEPMGVPD